MHELEHARNHVCLGALALLTGCTLHSRATHWNERIAPDGQPVYALTATNIGMNLAIVLPLLGTTSLDTIIDEATGEIAKFDSNQLRIVETESTNYWAAIPPVTWLLSPVVTSVRIEYRTSAAEQAEVHGQESGPSRATAAGRRSPQ
ncbi:MAG: hypothetical protein ABIP94_25095 [Planctomycetota bacterium]